MRVVGFVASLVALGCSLVGTRARAQTFIPGSWRLTQYWIAQEAPSPEDRGVVRILDRSGSTLTWACRRFASALAMEGTGRTWDGRLFNWASRENGHACYLEVDPGLYPYGIGVRGYALVPFRSLAVDSRFIPIGRTVELAELVGMILPDGTRHDGCFVAVDGGGAIRGHHIDLFVPSRDHYVSLSRAGVLPEEVHAAIDSPRCAHASRFAVTPIPGAPAGDRRAHDPKHLVLPPSREAD